MYRDLFAWIFVCSIHFFDNVTRTGDKKRHSNETQEVEGRNMFRLAVRDPDGLWFTAEKSGLYDIQLLGLFESFDEERQADGQFEEL